MQRWYLIRTKSGGEQAATGNLQRQGFEVYFPRLLQPLRRRARWVQAIVPLFPRYVFLRLNEGRQALGPVRSTVGVAEVVRFGSSYATVPDSVVGELLSRADPDSGLHRLTGPLPFTPGSPVRITMGPFSGLDGIFEREAGSERVIVLLNLLGHDTTVRIPAGFVAPVVAHQGQRAY